MTVSATTSSIAKIPYTPPDVKILKTVDTHVAKMPKMSEMYNDDDWKCDWNLSMWDWKELCI